MTRLTLQQRRDVRYAIQAIVSFPLSGMGEDALRDARHMTTPLIENLVDDIDYLNPEPRWVSTLAARREGHANGRSE